MAKSQLFKPPMQTSSRTAASSPSPRLRRPGGVHHRRDHPRPRQHDGHVRRGRPLAHRRALEKPRRGIGRLALLSGAPVVPVAIVGSSHVRNWKRGQFPKVRVTYGEPFAYERVESPPASRSRPRPTRSSPRSASSTTRPAAVGESAQGTSTESSVGESRATMYSAGSLSLTSPRCGSRAGGRRACRRSRRGAAPRAGRPSGSDRPGEHVERALAVVVVVRPAARAAGTRKMPM